VHTAPTFGADDARVAKENDIPPMLVKDENGNLIPLVICKDVLSMEKMFLNYLQVNTLRTNIMKGLLPKSLGMLN
jgi:isoleucyl-tRNA synthetase